MPVPVTDMIPDLIIKIITAIAAVSLPIMYLAEWKYGFGKRERLIHGICAIIGIVSLVTVYLLFKWKIGSVSGDVRGWAEDFFFSYYNPAFIVTVALSILLGFAAAIDHPMRKIRMSVTILLPVVMILLTMFVASLAGEGQFAVDFYIRALAPGLGLVAHVVPLCERNKKPA